MKKAALLSPVLFALIVCGQDDLFRLRVDVPLVTLDVGVFGANGRAITNLTRDDFQLYEDGQLREIQSFSSVETPYNVLSLLDCTGSVKNAWPLLIQAYSTFVNKLRPQDRFALAYFGNRPRTMVEWTSRNTGFTEALQMDFSICDSTDFYGAIDWSLTKLAGQNGRKGVVVFTDGVQTIGDGVEES